MFGEARYEEKDAKAVSDRLAAIEKEPADKASIPQEQGEAAREVEVEAEADHNPQQQAGRGNAQIQHHHSKYNLLCQFLYF